MRWIVAIVLASSVASAQGTPPPRDWTPNRWSIPSLPKPPPVVPCKKTPKQPCVQVIDIGDPLNIGGRIRSLSMLGFLERASEELERSSLEKKSFVPKLISTIDEAAL